MKVKYGRDQKIKGDLTENFDANYAFLEKALNRSGDIVKNIFYMGKSIEMSAGKKVAVIYVDGMTDADMIEDFVIRPLLRKFSEKTGQELLSYVENHVMETVDWKEDESFEEILTDILSGNTLVLVESCPKAIILSTKKYPSRGVGETQQEMVIRGPKDSFTENMRINTALIRRRIRDPRLKMEHTMVGERSKTDLAIVYMDDLVRPELLEKIRNKVKKMSFDGIFDGGMVEQLLEENRWTPFPQFQHTERPDKAASGLLEGRIALVVDNSPGVLLLPVTYQMFFQAGDDYYTRFAVASFARLLRFAASLFAIGFPGLYVAIAAFHTEMLPTSFLLSIATARTVVIVVAFTAIASFIVPNESFGSVFRLLKFLFIITAAVWGIYGYLLTFTALLLHLSQLESFGVPYMQPSVCGENLNYDDKKDHYVRYPFAYMRKRPVFTREGRRIRKK